MKKQPVPSQKKRAAQAPAKMPAPPAEKTHRQRFEQLLDDAVLGVPPKR